MCQWIKSYPRGNMSRSTANMLSFPFLAIHFCCSSEASFTEITNAIANSLAFSTSSFALLLTAVLAMLEALANLESTVPTVVHARPAGGLAR